MQFVQMSWSTENITCSNYMNQKWIKQENTFLLHVIFSDTVFSTFSIPSCIQTVVWNECKSNAIQMMKHIKHAGM